MTGKEKALTKAATSERATEETTADTGISTGEYYNESAGYIASLLMHGEKNALRTKDLLRLTGLKHSRDLQAAIEAERASGIPILTKAGSEGGYFLPSDDPIMAALELQKYCHFMEAKGKGCFRSSKAARKMLRYLERDLSGQRIIKEL